MKNTIILGSIIEDKQSRDAIHMAVAPVIADTKLFPGQPIGFVAAEKNTVGQTSRSIGIVDPFLEGAVFPGQTFWMLIYPNTITGLRHEWTHPAFDGAEEAKQDDVDSRQWLKDFAEKAGLAYSKLLAIIQEYVEEDEVWVEQGSQRAQNAFEDVAKDEFWKHIKNVTGMKRPESPDWHMPFSCTC